MHVIHYLYRYGYWLGVARNCKEKMLKRSLIGLFHGQRRYLLVPSNQSDPIKTNQEVIKELTKNLTGGESSFNPTGIISISNLNLPKSQDELEPRKMSDSFDNALIPLSSDEDLRNRYLTSGEWPRMGRLLEDMDVFAVHLTHKHVKIPNHKGGKLPFSIVTALVDQIQVHSILSHHLDFKISGHVTWVGRSSAETTLDLHQRNESGDAWNKVIEAQFLMVATDPLMRGPAFFNPLKLESKEEEDLFEMGCRRTQARKFKRKESLLKCPPNPDEQKLIHDIFVETLDKRSISFEGRILPPDSVWMDKAKLKSSVLCQPEKTQQIQQSLWRLHNEAGHGIGVD